MFRKSFRIASIIFLALLPLGLIGASADVVGSPPPPADALAASAVEFRAHLSANSNAGWEEVGAGSASGRGISDNSGGSYYSSLAIAPDGTPYVAWDDDSDGDFEVYVRRWNGNHWQEVGSGSATGGGISDNSGRSYCPSLAIAPDGTPYVAWYDDSDGDFEIYIRRWNGNRWQEVGTGSATGGGISDNSGESYYPSLAIAPDGTPYVAWDDDSDSYGRSEIYAKRWNGSNWVEIGTSSARDGGISNSSGSSDQPSVAIAPDGTPYVAWFENPPRIGDNIRIRVQRWNSSNWEEVGTSFSTNFVLRGGLFITPKLGISVAPNGTPFIAWEDIDNSHGDREIYVKRWNSSNWEEVGDDSASGGGISNNGGESWRPSTAIAPDGTPYGTWHDSSGGGLEIYVRRWTGSSWEEACTGSASGGGISNNSGTSSSPSVAIALDGTPYIAWVDDSSGNAEIYVRRWGGSLCPARNLQGEVKSQTEIRLTWEDTNTTETGYIVEYWAPPTEEGGYWEWVEVGHVSANATEFVRSYLDCGVEYKHRVRAYRTSGSAISDPSNVDATWIYCDRPQWDFQVSDLVWSPDPPMASAPFSMRFKVRNVGWQTYPAETGRYAVKATFEDLWGVSTVLWFSTEHGLPLLGSLTVNDEVTIEMEGIYLPGGHRPFFEAVVEFIPLDSDWSKANNYVVDHDFSIRPNSVEFWNWVVSL